MGRRGSRSDLRPPTHPSKGREGQGRWEAHTAAVESELEEGRRAVNAHHGAEGGDIQTKILSQGKEEE